MKDLGLEQLLDCPVIPVTRKDRIVIVSDLHMGDGGKTDDFARNSGVFLDALTNYYYPRGYTLLLNGDIEELLRHRLARIQKAWPAIYRLFDDFRRSGRLIRLRGNHEIVSNGDGSPERFDGDSVQLDIAGQRMLVFHGHQGGTVNSGKYNHIIGLVLRVFANTFRIGNRSIAHNSRKKYQLERQVYDFSFSRGIVSIIGHTHRPLFESLSKSETIAYRIERLCRLYPRATENDRQRIRKTIQYLKQEYVKHPAKLRGLLVDSLYGSIVTPCLFNAGCGIGKKGMTALEIKNGKIFLVYWSSTGRTKRYRQYSEYKGARRFGADTFRLILRKKPLDYIFSRLQLIAGEARELPETLSERL